MYEKNFKLYTQHVGNSIKNRDLEQRHTWYWDNVPEYTSSV